MNVTQLKIELVHNEIALVECLQNAFNASKILDLMNQRSNLKDLLIEALQDQITTPNQKAV